MSTSQEVQELPPDPVELVYQFSLSVDDLLAASEKLFEEPSEDEISNLFWQADAVRAAARPILDEKFFYEKGQKLLIQVGVDKIINCGNSIHETTKRILGDNAMDLSFFKNEGGEIVAESFAAKDFSEFGIAKDESGEPLPDEEQFEEMSKDVIKKYDVCLSQILDQFVEASLNVPQVAEVIQRRHEEMEAIAQKAWQRSERIKQAKLVGACLAASVIGSLVANKLNKNGLALRPAVEAAGE